VVVAELVPEVVRASRSHFTPWINGLFDDPRARVVVEDGRNLLLASPDRFDVVVADLFLPWKAGSGSLYALELYQAGLARLAPGGIYGQWLSLIQISHREFGTIARTLVEVFPRVTLWRGNYRKNHPLVLILGERDPAPLDSKAIQDRLSKIARNEHDASSRGIGRSAAPETAQELLLYYQGNLSQARQLLDAYPINSDDHPFVEYNAPITHRNKRTDEATAFRGSELLRFYDALFEAAPPEADPVLAELSERERKLPRAGLELYRSQVLKHSGDPEGAASAYQRYRGLSGGS
jgi:spermidine synthase